MFRSSSTAPTPTARHGLGAPSRALRATEDSPRRIKISPRTPLSAPLTSPLSRDLARSVFVRDTGTLARRRCAIAAAPPRHCRIAWTSRCASTSSTATPSHASRNAVVESPSSNYRKYTGRCSSPIPPSPASLLPLRPLQSLRGEPPLPPAHFPLSLVRYNVGMLLLP